MKKDKTFFIAGQLSLLLLAGFLLIEIKLLKDEVHFDAQSIIRENSNNLKSLIQQSHFHINHVTQDSQKETIVEKLRTLMDISFLYSQARIINNEGKEVFRLNKTGAEVEETSASGLQDKSKRYYHREILEIDRGTVYFSGLDHNVEWESSELGVPTFRVAKKIDDKSYAILNIDKKEILKEVGFERLNLIEVNERPSDESIWISLLKGSRKFSINIDVNEYLTKTFSRGAWHLTLELGLKAPRTSLEVCLLSLLFTILLSVFFAHSYFANNSSKASIKKT